MSNENRSFRRTPDFLARRHLKARGAKMVANMEAREARQAAGEAMAAGQAVGVVPPHPGPPFARSSTDPVAGVLRVIIEAAQAAAKMQSPSRSGRPVDYAHLLTLLDFVEDGGWELGVAQKASPGKPARRVGTSEKGALVKAAIAYFAARQAALSATRIRDLACQLANMAGDLPEQRVNKRT